MKTTSAIKKPFGTAAYSPVKHARYLDWEDAFDVEFDDGLSFLEGHKAIRKANKISPQALPVRVSVPRKFRTHFKIEYDNGQIAEVSWSFIREQPPKRAKKNGEPPLPE
ncbi:MAG TPA: hypothetical protein VEX43_10985 [Chthoniobacterales bacterium]|nr:hypothetical protein [Chthoniobacterales bacterium]